MLTAPVPEITACPETPPNPDAPGGTYTVVGPVIEVPQTDTPRSVPVASCDPGDAPNAGKSYGVSTNAPTGPVSVNGSDVYWDYIAPNGPGTVQMTIECSDAAQPAHV
jgi:hypothetical protein